MRSQVGCCSSPIGSSKGDIMEKLTDEELKKYIARQCKNLLADMDHFASEIKRNPCSALNWSESAFDGAAELDALRFLNNQLDKMTRDAIESYWAVRVFDYAKGSSTSTSTAANLMTKYKGKAAATVLELLGCTPDR